MLQSNENALRPGKYLRTNNHLFEVISTLGCGNFGITYLGRSLQSFEYGYQKIKSGTEIAIKEFFPNLPGVHAHRNHETGDVHFTDSGGRITVELAAQAFLKEASFIDQLSDVANVVDCYFVGGDLTSGTPFFVMPYLGDGSLAQCRPKLSVADKKYLLYKLLSALDRIHTRNLNTDMVIQLARSMKLLAGGTGAAGAVRSIAHLDIKPANIVMSKGEPYFIDFGIADGIIPNACSIDYAAIEQMNREFGRPDHLSDIYSLGATFYWLLKGEVPVDSLTRFNCYNSYSPLSSDAELRELYGDSFIMAIDQAMQIDRYSRWQSARVWCDAVFPRGCARPPSALDQNAQPQIPSTPAKINQTPGHVINLSHGAAPVHLIWITAVLVFLLLILIIIAVSG